MARTLLPAEQICLMERSVETRFHSPGTEMSRSFVGGCRRLPMNGLTLHRKNIEEMGFKKCVVPATRGENAFS
ncbi:hypothetical protein AAAK29_30095 [Mesorhizobium sp. CCNWLW179-1]|uniref:hypothetical protein n=1 Tax=unclassified Mesorhizobium TaxID=325217 RepID=UPI0030155AC7